jgi:hypothetical protein
MATLFDDVAGPRAATSTPPAETAEGELARRMAREVAAHEARDALGALALDVLLRQAEGERLFECREDVDRRAAEYGVDRDRAQTAVGNLLAILEKGPQTDAERATVAAFAVYAFGRRLAESAGEGTDLVGRFVRDTDWLELATPYRLRAFIDLLLPTEDAARIWRALAQAVAVDATGPGGSSPAVRGRNAARLSALSASSSEAARLALASVAATRGIDGPTRALAEALRGSPPPAPRLGGRVRRARRRGAVAVLAWVTGWALLGWFGRAVAGLFGIRREAELTLGDEAIELRERRFVLGRIVNETVRTLAPASILEASREVRYPSVHLLVGAIALSIGVLGGGLLVFDGVRSGELTLLWSGAALVLVGAGLDLALDVLVPGQRGQVTVELVLTSGRVLRLAGVPVEQADRFLGALARKLQAGAPL